MYSLTKTLSVQGNKFYLDKTEFDLQGVSFFNAIFNEEFCKSDKKMEYYLRRFFNYGINMVRVWCEWDFGGAAGQFVDVVTGKTSLFDYRGSIRNVYAERLKRLLSAADRLGMVVEVCALAHERIPIPDYRLFPYEIIGAQEEALTQLTRLLLPYRNVILQIWNEASFEVVRYFTLIKSLDPDRIVTNSPGYASDLGDAEQNLLLDVLTPHTARAGSGEFWRRAAEEIRSLLRYGKPVIDDEPARCGLAEHGGIPEGTQSWQHIEQYKNVRAIGAYHLYHHDMFQNGYGHPATPLNGIPDPQMQGVHHEVFTFIAKSRGIGR